MSSAINACRVLDSSDKVLAEAVHTSLASISSNAQSLINQKLELTAQPGVVVENDSFAQHAAASACALYGELEGDCTGTVRIVFSLATAITLSAYLRNVPDEDVLQKRGANEWGDEDEEAFREFGNIVLSSFDETLRSALGKNIQVKLTGTERFTDPECTREQQASKLLRDGTWLCYTLDCKVGEFMSETAHLLLPMETAESVNGGSLRTELDEGDEEDIEAAPIRGVLAAYVTTPSLLKTCRLSCRRVGLTFDRRPKNEVPNPAAYSDQVVIVEIGRGQERRFDWCRRLKTALSGVKVVLLLCEPTRTSVALAFRAQADAVLGLPIKERLLSGKLDKLLEEPAAV